MFDGLFAFGKDLSYRLILEDLVGRVGLLARWKSSLLSQVSTMPDLVVSARRKVLVTKDLYILLNDGLTCSRKAGRAGAHAAMIATLISIALVDVSRLVFLVG